MSNRVPPLNHPKLNFSAYPMAFWFIFHMNSADHHRLHLKTKEKNLINFRFNEPNPDYLVSIVNIQRDEKALTTNCRFSSV